MTKITLSIVTLMIMSIGIQAGGGAAPVEPQVAPVVKDDAFIKTLNGYIRGGYQLHDVDGDDKYTDLALGGKLHIEGKSFYGISARVSFYTTNALGKHEGYLGGAVPFFDGSSDSYSILGEAYLKGQWGNTTLKIGRQEIDTPFADTDDIGMIPNTFEAAVLINKDIADTTIILAQVQKMAGVDTDAPAEFSRINSDENVQTAGIVYEGIKGLALSAWYYNLKDFAVDKIGYLEATYETSLNGFGLGLGAQYASQNYSAAGENKANIFGVNASIELKSAGLTLGAAYNKSSDNAAINGFGGGPFCTSSEHLTLAEAGIDGKALMLTVEWDASIVGANGLILSAGKLTLENANGVKGDELDIVASYAFNDVLSINAIYSDIDDKINGDKFNNTRVFINYTF